MDGMVVDFSASNAEGLLAFFKLARCCHGNFCHFITLTAPMGKL